MKGSDLREDRKLKVFISYSRQDEDFAQELVAGLELAGFEPYLDKQDIAVGEDWEARLSRLIEAADTILFIISPDSVESQRCAWEVERTDALGKRLLPIVWRSVHEERVPTALRRLNYIYFDKAHSFGPSLSALSIALRTDFEWIREHTRIGEAALRWDIRGRPEALLVRGEELATTNEWLKHQPALTLKPTLLMREFIRASEEADAARLDAERQRLEEMAAIQGEREHALKQAEEAIRRRAKLRNMAFVTLSCVAALALWQSSVAVTQRVRAERSLELATKTANTLVNEMAQKLRGRVGVPLDIVRDILDGAQQLQRQLIETGEITADLRYSAAKALNEVLLTLLEQGDANSGGDVKSMLLLAQHLRAMTTELLKAQPENKSWRFVLTLSESRLGDALMLAGDPAQAVAAFKRGLEMRKVLLADEPQNPIFMEALATSHMRIGDALLAIGGDENKIEADNAYKAALAIRLDLLAKEPTAPHHRRPLAMSYERRGVIEFEFGQPAEALTLFQTALRIRQALSNDDPANVVARRDLAIAHQWLGDISLSLDQSDDALTAFTTSLDIRKRIALTNPSNQAQRDLAVSYGRIGNVMMKMQRSVDAIGWYRKSLAIREKLAGSDPNNAIWQSDLIVDLRRLAKAGDEPRVRLATALALARHLLQNGQLRQDQLGWVDVLQEELTHAP